MTAPELPAAIIPTYDLDGKPSGNLRCTRCLALFPIGTIHATCSPDRAANTERENDGR